MLGIRNIYVRKIYFIGTIYIGNIFHILYGINMLGNISFCYCTRSLTATMLQYVRDKFKVVSMGT